MQDYRTEVLGLVKAQQVKNAVIIPVGSKGGFFPKRLPTGGAREAILSAARAEFSAKGLTGARVNRVLEIDEKTQLVKNDEEANTHLTRKYRAPFTVPEKV